MLYPGLGISAIARRDGDLAKRYLPGPHKDLVASPLMHDTPAEIAQPEVKSWITGECEAIPGKTMPNFKVVTRDYANLFNQFVSLGAGFRNNGLGIHGTMYDVADVYDQYLTTHDVERWDGATYPSLRSDVNVCDAILHFAAETNGELAYRAFASESKKTGIDHTHLAADTRAIRMTFEDITNQPRRLLTTWTRRKHEQRTDVFRVLPERGRAHPVANAHRPAASVPRSRGLPLLRRAPAHAQAARRRAQHSRPRGIDGHRRSSS